MPANRTALACAIVCVTLIVCGFPAAAHCQANGPTIVLTNPQWGARAAALADSYSADDADVNSVFRNPASLSFLRRFSFSLNELHNWTNQAFAQDLTVPFRVSGSQTMAIGASVSHVGYLSHNILSPDLKVIEYGATIGYSLRLIPPLSIGTLIDMRYARGTGAALGAGTADIGLFYSPEPGFTYGAVYRGIGSRMKYRFLDSGVMAEHDTLTGRSFEICAAISHPPSSHEPWANISFASERSLEDNSFRIKGGLELYPVNFFALRIGYARGPHTVVARYGAGIRTGHFQLDYAVSPSRLEDRFDAASLTYFFGDGNN